MAAAPSPLQQSHLNHSDSEGSDSENEQQQQQQTQQQSTQHLTTKLSELALIEEVQVDVENLNPLSPEVISKQATINIGKTTGVISPLNVTSLRARAHNSFATTTRSCAGQSSGEHMVTTGFVWIHRFISTRAPV
jgi:hypothetical protein